MATNPLLEIRRLRTTFRHAPGPAVSDMSLRLAAGEVVGLVGESGCGKSVTAMSILRLFEEDSGTTIEGEIRFAGQNLLDLPERQMEEIRGSKISMIFQDPMSSLNPVFSIGDQIMESLTIHQRMNRGAARAKAIEMLRLVGIPSPETRVDDYPHQLSGGMRQRVMIAISLACRPQLLIADEPTTALDVTIQAQILDLMMELKEQLGMAIIMITHDLGIVSEMCDRVVIMYLGEVVEELEAAELDEASGHPYTIGLLQSMPSMHTGRKEKLLAIEGSVPPLSEVPRGCRFSTRCRWADERCAGEHPPLEEVGPRHRVRCWKYGEIRPMEGAGSLGEGSGHG